MRRPDRIIVWTWQPWRWTFQLPRRSPWGPWRELIIGGISFIWATDDAASNAEDES